MNKLEEKVLKEFLDILKSEEVDYIRVVDKASTFILKVIDEVVDNCDKDKWLGFYRDDILNGFTPKCSCGEIATTQTTRGEHAQEGLHRPCNWGYYCKKCYAEGLELELEAMGVYDK